MERRIEIIRGKCILRRGNKAKNARETAKPAAVAAKKEERIPNGVRFIFFDARATILYIIGNF